MYRYEAYGIPLLSTFSFPALSFAPKTPEGSPPWPNISPVPLRIEARALGEWREATSWEPGVTQESPGMIVQSLHETLAWVGVEGVGSFLLEEGTQLWVDLEGKSEDKALEMLVLGILSAGILSQRGLFPLHASGLVLGGKAIGLMGHSRQGKSTMAFALHQRGHSVMTDDVLPLTLGESGDIWAKAGFPQLKVGAEALEHYGLERASLVNFLPYAEKWALRETLRFAPWDRPLSCLYLLAQGDSVAIEPARSEEIMYVFASNTWWVRHRQAFRPQEQFSWWTRLMAQIPIRVLRYPRRFALLEEVAQALEEDALTLETPAQTSL